MSLSLSLSPPPPSLSLSHTHMQAIPCFTSNYLTHTHTHASASAVSTCFTLNYLTHTHASASAAITCFTSNYLTHPACPNSSVPLKRYRTDRRCRRNSSPGRKVAATGELNSDVAGTATRFGSGVSICCSLWPLSFPGFRHWGEGWPSGGMRGDRVAMALPKL
jgi:hypothetical protein